MATLSSILPGKSHGWRSLVGYSSWRSQKVRHDWAASLSLFILFLSSLFLSFPLSFLPFPTSPFPSLLQFISLPLWKYFKISWIYHISLLNDSICPKNRLFSITRIICHIHWIKCVYKTMYNILPMCIFSSLYFPQNKIHFPKMYFTASSFIIFFNPGFKHELCIALNRHVSLAFFNLEHSLILFPNLTLILRSSVPFSYRILQSIFIQFFHMRKLKLKSLHENSLKVFVSLSWDIWC